MCIRESQSRFRLIVQNLFSSSSSSRSFIDFVFINNSQSIITQIKVSAKISFRSIFASFTLAYSLARITSTRHIESRSMFALIINERTNESSRKYSENCSRLVEIKAEKNQSLESNLSAVLQSFLFFINNIDIDFITRRRRLARSVVSKRILKSF